MSRGSSLRNAELRCPRCESSTNLGEHYLKEHLCPGIWVESGLREECKAKARIVQRGAANLFSPEVLSSITVPRFSSPVLRSLSHISVVNLLPVLVDAEGNLDPVRLKAVLQVAAVLPPEVRDVLLRASDDDIRKAAGSAREQVSQLTPDQARATEFRELKQAVVHGLKHPGEAWTMALVGQSEISSMELGNWLIRSDLPNSLPNSSLRKPQAKPRKSGRRS